MSASPAAPRLLHDLPAVTVRTCVVSEMQNNVYLLTSKTTGAQILVDAADEPEAIAALLASAADDTPCEPHLDLLITTHRHWDHIRATAAVVEQHSPRHAAGAADAEQIEKETGTEVTERLEHGATVGVDGIELDVIGLRGHTPGSVALVLQSGPDEEPMVFSGDSLFPGGVGKTWSDEDFRSLLADVTARLFDVYEDDTVVHPGHGDSTTLGAERPHLDEWAERGW
ncbi:metallo-beta-lactamase superfamily protein [Micrococcus lylae]|uniref:MBL fold metallo-hydrolase n=1 Tax=Micrococcus lylae TaxID=1273 RepID=A0A1R4JGV0_9MICC|nr:MULTISPECIES: MBL fold metallo-hydrolase [Micrococcus]OFR86337.1 Zn-dependent hydrolase [Micrococcus sp. HMSC067E09]TFI00836.1 MBL fold metallo-hydrolase [Micrococcus lylae]SJN31310.1 metallo-beta-lactamase superfamily protein [Micrococcus lylae]